MIRENILPVIALHTNKPFSSDYIDFSGEGEGLIWGPYISLDIGTYNGVYVYDVAPGFSPEALCYDVVSQHGKKTITEKSEFSFISPSELKFSFHLAEPETAVEFRVYKQGQSGARIRLLKLAKEDGSGMAVLPHTYLCLKSREKIISALLNQECPSCPSGDVLVCQTADSYRYSKMLNVSSEINKAYCSKFGMLYQSFSGVVFGNKPYQATYNRTAILRNLVSSGFRGWVIYLDADAAVRDFQFDFKEYLLGLRSINKAVLLHPVHDHGSFFGNVNAGAFAFDLSHSLVRAVVESWYSLYRHYYKPQDYVRATNWTDLIDDQHALQTILVYNKEFLEDIVKFEGIQHKYIFQALRSKNSCESDLNDLEYRCKSLEDLSLQLL